MALQQPEDARVDKGAALNISIYTCERGGDDFLFLVGRVFSFKLSAADNWAI